MQLATFFKLVFTPSREGIVCIASRPAKETKGWKEAYFDWPKQAEEMQAYIEERSFTHDLWFCPQLLDTKKRDRTAVGYAPTVWADLDTCDPELLLIEPTLVVQSSPDRYQAYWLLEDDYVMPTDVEDAARRLAYYHADEGADKSGWDLSQLLRIPGTKNFKYPETPVVTIVNFRNETVPLSTFFETYPDVPGIGEIMDAPMPTEYESATDVMLRHRATMNPLASILFAKPSIKGDKTRSTDLWKLECVLFESGLSTEEVFWVVNEANCNKYEEDGRDIAMLWRDVLRAKQYLTLQAQSAVAEHSSVFDPILSDQERYEAIQDKTIIEDYAEWAKTVTDAAEQYHPICAFMMLSSLFAGRMTLATQFGKMTTNLWCMLLADTTRTRKSTAMELALDIMYDIDENVLLATDGSPEGMLDAIAARPGRTSLFHRDEFAGMLKGMVTKEYLAGMPETLTKLYDGKQMKRLLRKQVIDIRKPVFILYTGGTKSTIMQLLNRDMVDSGFLPRFIFVTADSRNMPPEQPLGPPTLITTSGRDKIVRRLREKFKYYSEATQVLTIGTKSTNVPKDWQVELTTEAWAKYNEYAGIMQKAALTHSDHDILLPCMNRLGMSGLKASVLIAASRREHEDKIEVTELDVIHAFFYVEQWREYLMEVVENLGKSQFERMVTSIADLAHRENGILRGTIMRRFKLNARQADDAIGTAEQRMLISTKRAGKHISLHPYDEIG